MEGVYRVIVEGDWNVHNLCHIAPEETMALKVIKIKAFESLNSAVKQFKDIARWRMAGHDDLPSYTLWSQEHWTIEQSFYKLTSDDRAKKKVTGITPQMFREDIKVLHDKLHGC